MECRFLRGGSSRNLPVAEPNEVGATEIEYIAENNDARSYRVSFEKVRHVLGFAPRHRIEDGVQEMAELFRTGRIDGSDPRYSNLAYLREFGFTGQRGSALPDFLGEHGA